MFKKIIIPLLVILFLFPISAFTKDDDNEEVDLAANEVLTVLCDYKLELVSTSVNKVVYKCLPFPKSPTKTRTSTRTSTIPTNVIPTNTVIVNPTNTTPTSTNTTNTTPTNTNTPTISNGTIINVNPSSNLQSVIDNAPNGATIVLADGVYLQDLVINRGNLTITGSRNAIYKGEPGDSSRVIEINSNGDNLTFRGFTMNGLHGSNTYRGRAIYALGTISQNGVDNLTIDNMAITNFGGECLRLRYYARNVVFSNNIITNCGRVDYPGGVWAGSGKNGEGIYIGTAPEQEDDGKSPGGADLTRDIKIFNNVFNTQGNECVDIKENSTNVEVYNNECTGNKDENAAGMGSRGNGNIFRNNNIYGNVGAGIRFGGDTSNMGINNSAYSNIITNNQSGGIKFQAQPQNIICGNTMSNNTGGNSVGTYGDNYNPTAACQ